MIAELGYQDVGEEPRTCDAAFDRPTRCAGLKDLRAGRAGELRPHVADNLELLGDPLQDLGDILAQIPQLPTAMRTGTVGRHRRMRYALAWQCRRQRPAYWLGTGDLITVRGPRRLGTGGLKLLDRQLQLLDALVELFRGAAILGATQLGEHQLEMLDLKIPVHQGLPHRRDELPEARDIIG